MKFLLDKTSDSGFPFFSTMGSFFKIHCAQIFFLEEIARLAQLNQLSRRLHSKSDLVIEACF